MASSCTACGSRAVLHGRASACPCPCQPEPREEGCWQLQVQDQSPSLRKERPWAPRGQWTAGQRQQEQWTRRTSCWASVSECLFLDECLTLDCMSANLQQKLSNPQILEAGCRHLCSNVIPLWHQPTFSYTAFSQIDSSGYSMYWSTQLLA